MASSFHHTTEKASQFFGAAKVREFGENKGIKGNLTKRIIKSLRDLEYHFEFNIQF